MKRFLLAVLFSALTNGQDIVYPDKMPIKTETTTAKETQIDPIFDRSKCSDENQLFYPQKDNPREGFCDCGPAKIYYSPTDACYPVYMQGPCDRGEHLVLKRKRNRSNSECVTNPCDDGYLRYKGRCYSLESPDPCIDEGKTAVLSINSTTLEVECLESAPSLSLIKVPANCPPGSKRDIANRCRENFNV